MIAIIPIATGQPLDLAPDAEFEIQMEQPLLSDELPAPFSTQISFPPTARNNGVFGFAGARVLFEPAHKTVYCRLEIAGLPWMTGTLVYDGIEDGNLQYTFTGQDILGLDDDAEHFPSSLMTLQTMDTYAGMLGRYPVMAPLIINDGQQAKELGDDDGQVSPAVKYKNYYGYKGFGSPRVLDKKELVFTPVRNIKACFLDSFFPSAGHGHLEISQTLEPFLEQMAMVCPYNNSTWAGLDAIPIGGEEYFSPPPLSIPKISAKSILENVCRILCCAIYIDSGTIRMLNAADVLGSAALKLGDELFSDSCSCSTMKARNYAFKFGNDESDNTYTPKSAAGADDQPEQTSLGYGELLRLPSSEYKLLRHILPSGKSGDIYSAKSYAYAGLNSILCDNLFHNLGSCEQRVGASESIERSSSWKLVRCVPQNISQPAGDSPRSVYHMTPVIPAVGADEERGDCVYIGLLKSELAQLVDKGCYYNASGTIVEDNVSLAPADLYSSLHHTLADWVSRDRQVLKVSLNVSPAFLTDKLKLWRRYYFAGRYWLIKSLTVHCSAKADKPEVEAEFVEC